MQHPERIRETPVAMQNPYERLSTGDRISRLRLQEETDTKVDGIRSLAASCPQHECRPSDSEGI